MDVITFWISACFAVAAACAHEMFESRDGATLQFALYSSGLNIMSSVLWKWAAVVTLGSMNWLYGLKSSARNL